MEDRLKLKCIVKGEKITRDIHSIDYDYMKVRIEIAGRDEYRDFAKIKAILHCTGLRIKDKLLYEKDRFKYKAHDGFILDDFESVVEWDNEHGAFYFMHQTIKHFFNDFDEVKEDLLDYCEIIGNVFEQPTSTQSEKASN